MGLPNTTTISTSTGTNSIFKFIGNIHVIQDSAGNTLESPTSHIFEAHLSQIAIISAWMSGNIFHIAWQSNYTYWQSNPQSITPIAHTIWDPHYSLLGYDSYALGETDSGSLQTYSGMYHWMYTVGIRGESDLYIMSISLEILSFSLLSVCLIHRNLELASRNHSATMREVIFAATTYRLNYHLGVFLGVSSVLWSIHLINVSLPVSRGASIGYALEISPLLRGDWISYSTGLDTENHIYGAASGSGTAVLTFTGSLRSTTMSMDLSDISHHHLAIGILSIWASHMYISLYRAIGHRLKEILGSYGNASGTGSLMKILLNRSIELELSLSLILLSQASSYAAQHIYSLSPYVYLNSDYVTTVSLYVHHMWISSFLMIGAFVHGTLFLIKDFSIGSTHQNLDIISRIQSHKSSLVSHLSWVTLWLGFHTLLIYVHNDVVMAFGDPDKQIAIEPIYAQVIQSFSGKSTYGITSVYYQTGFKGLEASFLPIGPTDLMAHHAIALGLHVTALIQIKGALDSRGSRLIPDKANLGFSYPCDGPGRGGTCDVTAWDSMYLSLFWMLNTLSWTLFYFHWKHLTLWQNNYSAFAESGTYLMAWFRDYLWFNSSPLIRGYSAYGSNDLGVWSWLFLAAHLCWATGFMFLISWRGYWQELIESIVWSHTYTPIVSDIWNASKVSPLALSIVQARFVGLVHFSVGLIMTYASFVIASTS
jgi:photosystem I P700 chlorophyll a apoprotein A2